jgi:diguanylate cyclase (GGDEF)-like protein
LLPSITDNQIDDPLISNSGIENMRAQRVWRMVWVQLFTWLFFAFYLYLRGRQAPALACLLESTFMFLLTRLQPICDGSRYRNVLNASLIASGTGVLFVSLNDPILAHTMFFFPVSVLFSSMLIGVRAAFGWMLVGFVAHFAYYLTTYGPVNLWLYRIDELTVNCGVIACWFFCCQQGDAFYRERTKNLKDLSSSLRTKSIRLEKLATTDSLTGLFNRHQFQVNLEELITASRLGAQQVALVVIDMNGFKQINDTQGHLVGDQSLVMVANRLREHFPDADIARMGGDEFCLIFSDVSGLAEGRTLASETCEMLKGRYSINDEFDFPLSASVGVALYPLHSDNSTDLFAYADTAMYIAKAANSGFAVYEPGMTEKLVGELELLEKLRMALDRQEFSLLYQPQVCLNSNSIIGVEALIRWQHGGEVISPNEFIPLLEKSGLIVDVGRWIIRESCRQLRQWQDAGIALDVSINLSALQFNDPGFDQTIEQPIREFGLSADRLDFEITESLLITDVNLAVDRLNRIKELGASISIDDFGTGYSSLAYLRQFPIDRLKIDRAFVKDIPDRDDGVIATSVVALAKAIGLRVLAEGVETPEQVAFLKEYDCDEYQGYFFSRPISAKQIEMMVREEQAPTEGVWLDRV